MTISDEVFRVTKLGYNDGKALYFEKTATESLQDAERRYLIEQTAVQVGTAISDLWYQFGVEQFPAALTVNDIQLAFWQSKAPLP